MDPYRNSRKQHPTLQARHAANLQNPEFVRRRDMYRKARGERKLAVKAWNHEWACAGRPDIFPDFSDWLQSENGRKFLARRAAALRTIERTPELREGSPELRVDARKLREGGES